MRTLLALPLCLMPFHALADAAADKGFLTSWLEENLSGGGRTITIDGFQGALSSEASLTQMTIADSQGIWLTLKDVKLVWDRTALFSGAISITTLSAGEIDLERLPVTDAASALPAAEATPFVLPDLPVSVAIDAISAPKLLLGPTVLGQAVEASLTADMKLSGGEGSAHLNLLRGGDGPQGHVTLAASYANGTKVLGLTLDAAEDAHGIAATLLHVPGGPATSLKIDGTGPLSDFAATVDLSTDGATRLAGKVSTGTDAAGNRSFAADLAGDPTPVFLPEYASFFGPNVSLSVKGRQAVDGALRLETLSVQSQALSLQGSLALAADGQPENLNLTGKLGLETGRVNLPATTADPITLQSADLTLSYDKATGPLWHFATTVNQFDSGTLAAGLLKLTAEGQLGAQVFDGSAQFDASGLVAADPALAQALGASVSGTADFKLDQATSALQVSTLTLTAPGYAVQTQGTIGKLAELQGHVAGQYDDLSRLSGLVGKPLTGAARFVADGSFAALSGAFDIKGRVTGQGLGIGIAQVDALLAGASTVDFDAKRDESGTVLRSLAVRAASLSTDLQGSVTGKGATLTGTLGFPDVSVLGAGYKGALTAQVDFSGGMQQGQIKAAAQGQDLAVGQRQMDGILAGTSDLTLEATYAGGIATIQKAQVTSAQGQVAVSGTVSADQSDVQATLALVDLSVMGPGYRGAVKGEVGFTGGMEKGHISASVQGQDIAVGQPQADGLLAGASDVTLEAAFAGGVATIEKGVVSSPQGQVVLAGTASVDHSELKATLSLPSLKPLGAAFKGKIDGTAAFVGKMDDATVTLDASASNLAVGQAQADVLLRGASKLSAQVSLTAEGVRIDRASISNPQVTANLSGTAVGAVSNLTLSAKLANLGLLLPQFPGAVTVTGTVAQRPEGTSLNLAAKGPGQIDAKLGGTVAADYGRADLKITGSATAALANGFISPRSVDGAVRFDLRLVGPLALSSVSGPVSISGGRLADPSLPFGLTDMAATAKLGGGRVQLDVTTGVSTGGKIGVQGSVGLASPYPADLSVKVTQAVLKDPQLFETVANGTVSFKGTATGGATIAGSVALGRTELHIPSTGMGADGGLPGLKHRNDAAAVKATRGRAGVGGATSGKAAGPAFALDLSISAPNQVFIRGRGLDAELGGSLVLRGTTANIVPSGAFNLIRGRLDILGKRLVLTEAQIQMQGALVPYVHVLASVESADITSSVQIEGDATNPAVTFVSVPELPQEEVLAHLLFNKGLSNISAFQAAQLASAVATLAGGGGGGIMGALRSKTGLDNLDVKSDATGNTSVTAGKYINEKTYSEVTVDQAGKSSISLNYDVTRNITLKGHVDSDSKTGVGIYLKRDY